MVSRHNLLTSFDRAEAADLPIGEGDRAGLPQCWIGEGLGMRVAIGNYQRSSLTGQIRSMNGKEIGEILEAMAGCLSD
ncbi:hypothetical protein [Chroococcidiopsis sp.]|uniref:hypothetical protein n=1 Tax=Chroococcidiopsis sp. TaxID=3088168 RepID=UPI003F3AAEF2